MNIHKVYMENSKKQLISAQQILEQSLWLNKYITIKNKCLYWNSWKKAGISHINDIINQSNGNVLFHEALQKTFNFKINYIDVLQLQSSIPKYYMNILKQNTCSTPVTNIQITIFINNYKLQLYKVKCKIYYWHLINNIIHIPKVITKCENIYTNFNLKDHNFWKPIFKMSFLFSRHTAIQTFQYKMIHRTLPCNECLNNIKINTYIHTYIHIYIHT